MPEPTLYDAKHDRRVDYIELAATDIDATKRFYTTVFGWKFTDYGPDYTSFEDGRINGGFYRADAARAGTVLVVMFAVDLAAMEQRVRSAGGKIVKPVFSFPGGRRFHFSDPSGNELAVWSDR
jgi:predicted enzyme related to lactoylglutathione lyase